MTTMKAKLQDKGAEVMHNLRDEIRAIKNAAATDQPYRVIWANNLYSVISEMVACREYSDADIRKLVEICLCEERKKQRVLDRESARRRKDLEKAAREAAKKEGKADGSN